MSTQLAASKGKTKFAFSEDVIKQMFEMAPTKAKDNDDCISLASSTDERIRDLNISLNLEPLKDDKSEKSAKLLEQDDILAKYYEFSSHDSGSTTSEVNVSQGIDQENRKDNCIYYEMEVEQLKKKNESLKAELNHYESMKPPVYDFKKCIEGSLESKILFLEKEKSELMLELESMKSHCVKLENFNENLLSDNVSLKKKVEHLLSQKNSLQISVDEFKSLDEYVKILEEKVSTLDNVVQERNQLKFHVMRHKEKVEELANLQQLVKTVTNQRDTSNFQLQELSKKYSQQQDSAKNAVMKLNRTLNELCEKKEICNGLLLLINEQYSLIDELKKKLLAVSENKEFYRKWYNVKFKQLNLQTFESESTKRLLSNSYKIFEQTLKKIKAILSVIEYLEKINIAPQKIVLLVSVIHTVLADLSAEMGECARKFPRVSGFCDDEKANGILPIQNRSFSESDLSVETLGKNDEGDASFPREDVFSAKCALISICAGNEALVKNLFSIEYSEENNCKIKVNSIDANTANQSRLDELKNENSDLKAELSVRNEHLLTLQEQVEASNNVVTETDNFVNELLKRLIEFKEELKNVCSSCMLVREDIENKNRSVIIEPAKSSSESISFKNKLQEYQNQITWLESEFNEMKKMLVALNEKAKNLPVLEEKNSLFPLKAQFSNDLLKNHNEVIVASQKNKPSQRETLTPEKEFIDPKTKLPQIEETGHKQHFLDNQRKTRKRKLTSLLCKQYVSQEVENQLPENFAKKTSLHPMSRKSKKIEHQEFVIPKKALGTFSLSENLFSALKKLENIPVLHKIFCKNIAQLGDLLLNFEIKIEGKKGLSSSPTIILNLDTLNDNEIPFVLQQIIPRHKGTVLRIFFTTHSNANYLCTLTSICGGKLVKKSSGPEKKQNDIPSESNEELSGGLFPPEKEKQFLTLSESNIGFNSVEINASSRPQKMARKDVCQKIMETDLSQFSVLSKKNNLHLNSLESNNSSSKVVREEIDQKPLKTDLSGFPPSSKSSLDMNSTEMSESISSQKVSREDTYQKNVETDSNQFVLRSKNNLISVESNSSGKIVGDDMNQKITGPHSSQFLLTSKQDLELNSELSESNSSLKVVREETNQKLLETDLSRFPPSSKSSLDVNSVEMSESNSLQEVVRKDSNQRNVETESSQFSMSSKNRLNFNSVEMKESNHLRKITKEGSKLESVPNQFSVLNLSSVEMSESNGAQVALKENTGQENMKSDDEYTLLSVKQNVAECWAENSFDSETGQTASKGIHSSLCGNDAPNKVNSCGPNENKFLKIAVDREVNISECVLKGITSELPSSKTKRVVPEQDSEMLRPNSKTYSRNLIQEVSKYSLVTRVRPTKYQIQESAIVEKLSEVFPQCTAKQYNAFLVICAEKCRLHPEELFFWSVFRTALSNPLAKLNQRLILLIHAIICIKLTVLKLKKVRNQMLEKLWLEKGVVEINSGCVKSCGCFRKGLLYTSENHQKLIYFALETMTDSFPDECCFSVINKSFFTSDLSETEGVNLSDLEINNACLQAEPSNVLKYCKNFITSHSDFSKNLESTNSTAPRKYFQTREGKIGLQTAESVSQTEELVCENCKNISVNNVSVQQKTNGQNRMNGGNTFSVSKLARYLKISNKSGKKNWFMQLNYLRLKNFKLQKQFCNFKVEFLNLKNLKSLSDFEERMKKLNQFLMEKNEAQNVDEIKNSYEEKFVKLRKAHEIENAENVVKIKNSYEKRIVDLKKAYEEKLTEVRECHDKDFKSLSQIYVEKLKFAEEVYSQTVESIEETNIKKLEEYQRFYETKTREWETVIINFSLEINNLQKHTSELEEKYSMELLSAKNKYETLFNFICEAFDNEKVAIYALLSESMNNFEDDFKDSLRKIALRLDRDASISNRLFVKELERCRRQYEHNLKKQKMCYKNLLEEAKKSFGKKVSQKSLSFSDILTCNCDAVISFEDIQTPNVHHVLERSQCEGDSCFTNISDCCAVWECESPC